MSQEEKNQESSTPLPISLEDPDEVCLDGAIRALDKALEEKRKKEEERKKGK